MLFGHRFVNGIKAMDTDSETCVGINEVEGEWFNINIEEMEGYVMSMYVDDIIN